MDAGLFFALAPNTRKLRKNIGFSMIFAYHACCAQNKKTIKNRSRRLSDKASHKYDAGTRSWSSLGSVLEKSGTLFGASWPALGRFWTVLGSSWAALSRLLGPTWPLLGTSWLVWAASWKDFGPQDPPGPSF